MLNRRLLRVKVMQALYAIEVGKEAHYRLAKEIIEEGFVPDWDEKPTADMNAIAAQVQQSQQIFEENYQTPPTHLNQIEDEKVRKVTLTALNYYQQQLTRDRSNAQKQLDQQIENLYDVYLLSLLFFVELSDYVAFEKEATLRNPHGNNVKGVNYHLADNTLCQVLRNNEELQSTAQQRSLNWQQEKAKVKEFYRVLLLQDKKYQDYENSEQPSPQEDYEIVMHILKRYLYRQTFFNRFALSDPLLDKESIFKTFQTQSIEEIQENLQKLAPEMLNFFAKQLEITAPHPRLFVQLEQKLKSYYQDFTEEAKKTEDREDKSPFKALNEHEREKRERSNYARRLLQFFLTQFVQTASDLVEENRLREQAYQPQIIEAFIQSFLFFHQSLSLDWGKDHRLHLQIKEEKELTVTGSFFGEMTISWHEDLKVVQSMVNRTLKKTSQNGVFNLMSLSQNWDSDQIFYQDLFRYSVEHGEAQDEVIARKAKNWNIERLHLTDRIILRMAICEMIYFYSIPIKASINEYIELAKSYGTLKSHTFVNGMLDKIAKELSDKRVIRKSGMGLMDNK